MTYDNIDEEDAASLDAVSVSTSTTTQHQKSQKQRKSQSDSNKGLEDQQLNDDLKNIDEKRSFFSWMKFLVIHKS